MANFTFNDLATHSTAPPNVFVVSNDKLMLDLGVLIGENVASLSATQVTEVAYKFLKLAYNAQTKFNSDNSLPFGARIASFSTPSYATPQESSNSITADASITVTARLQVDGDEVSNTLG